jgi:hypothetical protein
LLLCKLCAILGDVCAIFRQQHFRMWQLSGYCCKVEKDMGQARMPKTAGLTHCGIEARTAWRLDR